jgi:hypothetical protein
MIEIGALAQSLIQQLQHTGPTCVLEISSIPKTCASTSSSSHKRTHAHLSFTLDGLKSTDLAYFGVKLKRRFRVTDTNHRVVELDDETDRKTSIYAHQNYFEKTVL